MTMKKEGIQTRNRKLSSKGKKKKGSFGFSDGLLNNSKSFPGFAHPMSSAMSAVNQYRDFMYRDTHAAHNMGQFGSHFGHLTGSGMHMSQMSGQMGAHLSSLSLPTSSGLNLGLPNSMVGATA